MLDLYGLFYGLIESAINKKKMNGVRYCLSVGLVWIVICKVSRIKEVFRFQLLFIIETDYTGRWPLPVFRTGKDTLV